MRIQMYRRRVRLCLVATLSIYYVTYRGTAVTFGSALNPVQNPCCCSRRTLASVSRLSKDGSGSAKQEHQSAKSHRPPRVFLALAPGARQAAEHSPAHQPRLFEQRSHLGGWSNSIPHGHTRKVLSQTSERRSWSALHRPRSHLESAPALGVFKLNRDYRLHAAILT